MSGIMGYFSPVPSHQKIFQLAKTMNYDIQDAKASELSFVCHLAVKSSAQKETTIQYEKNGFIIFCGEIFNETIANPKKVILDVCKNREFDKLKELNGSFLVAIYDQTNEKLTLINDRFGSKKLFYYYDKNNFFFSPKIAPLMTIAEKKQIRKDALIDFLIFGFFLEDKTFDAYVHQLAPASVLEISKNQMTVKRYWNYPCDGNYDRREPEVLLKELAIRWQNAVDNRLKNNEKIIIQISGGLDSRAILAASLKSIEKENILLYNFGEAASYDYEIGTRIASSLGILHASFHPTKERFAEQYEKSFLDSEGMIDATPYFPVHMNQSLTQFCNKIYNGYMGGELMGPLIFSKITRLNLEKSAEYEKAKKILFNHHKIHDVSTVSCLFNPSYIKDEILFSSFEKSVEDLTSVSSSEFPNYCAQWMYLNESDKYTAFCNFRFKNQFHYNTPFLDNDLVDFVLRIPPSLRMNKVLYKKMLQKTYTELFRLPTKNTLGLSLQTNHIALFRKRVLAFLQRQFNNILNYIGRPNRFFNKNENYINYDDLIRTNKEYQQFMKSMLDKVKIREFFNPEYIEILWNQHLKGKKNYSKLFGYLVTIEMTLEKYYDQIIQR